MSWNVVLRVFFFLAKSHPVIFYAINTVYQSAAFVHLTEGLATFMMAVVVFLCILYVIWCRSVWHIQSKSRGILLGELYTHYLLY